jgi:L-2-hydroxyglutarate oxidase LhgO
LINCGGLQSDIVAQMMGGKKHDSQGEEHRIIPFRGEYRDQHRPDCAFSHIPTSVFA